jgi:hypothetical protein
MKLRSRAVALCWVTCAWLTVVATPVARADSCGSLLTSQCGVIGESTKGDFHGLIMVPGEPGLLDAALHASSQAGCGDCVWTVILACPLNSPNDPNNQQPCVGTTQGTTCPKGQQPYRVYLTTSTVNNRLVDVICLGGVKDVIDITDRAATDVQNYLKNVMPPDLVLTTQPPRGALAGLPAYFMVRPPAQLRPHALGSGLVRERITIRPAHFDWSWGDGSADLVTDDPGAPYPQGRVTHVYRSAGDVRGTLTTQWAATYTVTADGRTFGPFPAIGGTVPHAQTFALTVDTAHSHLVSGQ